MDGSPASNAAELVTSLFGHVDGEEWRAASPSVGAASVVAAPRSCLGCLVLWQRVVRGSVVWCGGFFWRKLSASSAAAAMPMGVVTLLGALMCYPPHISAPDESL
jgi:hypothetical protein